MDNKGRRLTQNGFHNPREFMRARHPDLFADTHVDDASCLPRAVFEYYLDTLTNRKQEYEFEHFCRKLAEKEICPNLRVQTGPTGGGDSKVDSETYPVAPEIAERWWIGTPSAGTERWAFAFSAKKNWKPKVKADVQSIVSTGRDYKRIYFFTNQFVSDKDRSNQEDTLAKQTGIPVHIFDRAWIVNRVYEGGHLDIAIAALGIEGATCEKRLRLGPRDTSRLAELEELDQQIADPTRYQDARYQLVEDCLRSTILARGLERPRTEIEARFAQTARLAAEVDYRQQRLRVAYNQAWTAFWWYEDYDAFNRIFDEVEQFVNGSTQANEIELLMNLWQLLTPSVAAGHISAEETRIETRSLNLIAALEAIASDPVRVNNALQARTDLALVNITLAFRQMDLERVESGWQDLSQIIDESITLGAYPIEQLYDVLAELGEFDCSSAFDELFEKIVGVMRLRRSDGEAGKAYNQRAIHKLQMEKPYDAIRLFGLAEELLAKEEYQEQLLVALIGGSYAYERAGLLWAARTKALAAVERSLSAFNEIGRLPWAAIGSMKRLVWIELQLGRIPYLLNEIALTDAVASHVNLSDAQRQPYDEERQTQEAVLGIHFLNLPTQCLQNVTRLPDALEQLGLPLARMALMFVLGQEQTLRDEGYIPVEEDADGVRRFFESWRMQPAADDIPPQPTLIDGKTSILRSTILGTEFVVEVSNDAISFWVAESLLGALEAFLATSNEELVVPYMERFTISIRTSDQLAGPPQLFFPSGKAGSAEVVHSANIEFETLSERQDYILWLQDSLVHITSRAFVITDVEKWMEVLAGHERGFSRALIFGDVLTLARNVFGEKPRLKLSDWLASDMTEYEIRNTGEPTTDKEDSAGDAREPLRWGDGPPPPEMIDISRLKHTDRHVLSPIDMPLWDSAKWRATGFALIPGLPPVMAVVFENGEAGQAIFRSWQERWGREDSNNDLRVAVIKGVSSEHPLEYVVSIGPNAHNMGMLAGKAFLLVSRFNRMNPASMANLDRFIEAYEKVGTYLLVPAQMDGVAFTPFPELAIKKRHIDLRQAWQIGENDPDIVVLRADDAPIIPAAETDPPVKRALERNRTLREDDRH